MTIVERLRHLAQNNRSIWRTVLESELLEVADALERSGALVPVKEGEMCERRKCYANYFECESVIYREEIGGDKPKRLIDGEPVRLSWSAPVQPVRLVAITEWEGE